VHRCIEEGLVGGDNFAVDANRIDANANRGKGEFNNPVLPKAVLHRRAVQEYIAQPVSQNQNISHPSIPRRVGHAQTALAWRSILTL